MQSIFYIFYFFVRLFGFLPFRVIYLISDFLYFTFYYLIPYRRKVIQQNIERSFPNFNKAERIKVIKGFYRNLCDIFVEGIKGFTISKKDLLKRYVFINPDVIDKYYDNNQEIISVGAHYANWEWGIMAAPLQIKHKIYAFYTPLTNKSIDAYMRENRKKWGTELLPVLKIRTAFSEEKQKPSMYFFGADQSPIRTRDSHWMQFLNQDTACMKSPEFFSKFHNLPIIYFDVQRVKRGFYQVNLQVLDSNPEQTDSGEITEKYMHTL